MRNPGSGRAVPTSMTYRPLLRVPEKTGRQNLNPTEQALMLIVFLVVVACLLMVMCVGLALPYHWLNETSVRANRTEPALTTSVATVSTTIAGSSPAGTSPAGTSPAGSSPAGSTPTSTTPAGSTPASTTPAGTTPASSSTTNTTQAPPIRKFSDICVCHEHRVEVNCNATLLKLKREAHPIQCDNSYEHPYLVSLSLPVYIDDLEEREFACTGTILSKHWVLTGGDCIQHDREIRYLRLRAGSVCWSHGGTEHHILLYEKYKSGPVLVKVAPNFIFNNYVQVATVFHGQNSLSPLTSVTVGWARRASLKYSKYAVLKWSPKKCPSCMPAKIIFHANCTLVTGRPLVNVVNRYLLGLLSEGCVDENEKKGEEEEETIFVSVHNTQILAWITKVLDTNSGSTHTHSQVQSASTVCDAETCTSSSRGTNDKDLAMRQVRLVSLTRYETTGISSEATFDETVSASTLALPETLLITALTVSSTTSDASTKVSDNIYTDENSSPKTDETNNAASIIHTTIFTNEDKDTAASTNIRTKPESSTDIPARPESSIDVQTSESSTDIQTRLELSTDIPIRPESSTDVQTTLESSTDIPTRSESSTDIPTRPESSTDVQTSPESSTDTPTKPESSTDIPTGLESSTDIETKSVEETTKKLNVNVEPIPKSNMLSESELEPITATFEITDDEFEDTIQ